MAEGLGAVQESLLQEITCNICLRLMVDPRTLPCTHVYCSECLERLHERYKETRRCLQCPECHQTVQIPSNDTAEFPKDFRTARLKEVYETILQINQSTCPTTNSTMKSRFESIFECQFHGSPIEMYCISCRDVLCKECVQTHKDHNYDYLIEKNVMGRDINCLNEQSLANKSRLDDYNTPLNNTHLQDKENHDHHAEQTQEMSIIGDYCHINASDALHDVEQEEGQPTQNSAIVTEVSKYKSKVGTAITEIVQTRAEVDSQARIRQQQIDVAFEEMISLVQGKWKQIRTEVADEHGKKM